jgi:hypothetical protein
MMRDQVVGNWKRKLWLTERQANVFGLFGRLKPGVTREHAQAEMSILAQQLAAAYPDPQRKTSVRLSPHGTFVHLEPEARLLVAPMLTAVGLILLIACMNVTLARRGDSVKSPCG